VVLHDYALYKSTFTLLYFKPARKAARYATVVPLLAYNKEHRSQQCKCSCVNKLSCRREAVRCFVALNISLSHSRSLSFEMTPLS